MLHMMLLKLGNDRIKLLFIVIVGDCSNFRVFEILLIFKDLWEVSVGVLGFYFLKDSSFLIVVFCFSLIPGRIHFTSLEEAGVNSP